MPLRRALTDWTVSVPLAALLLLIPTWGRVLPVPVVVLVAVALGAAVLASVHHAEVIAHRVGEPYGSVILAVAVTIIEVSLIVTLMISGDPVKTAPLARDTVFAAVMLTCNGIVGLCLLSSSLRRHVAVFNSEGAGGALATVATLATLSLVVPAFTTSRPGPEFSTPQLAFAGVSSLVLYGVFIGVQTVRHRDYFLPLTTAGKVVTQETHADPPSVRRTWASLGLLIAALIAVVGDAKSVSPTIERLLENAGLPLTLVGIVIAMLVLAPETLAAVRAARRDRTQTSLNLAYGSAIASIGLTIPAVAVASLILDRPLDLGLGPTEIVLFALTVVVGTLTIVPGRATLLQSTVHLSVLAAYLFLAISP